MVISSPARIGAEHTLRMLQTLLLATMHLPEMSGEVLVFAPVR
jgi:hypothetical protein